ncbi:MAG TPA: hypothetical protein VN634_17165 [Candidatus Limnocylindrales bacterium]|nr:hypothetical protein [Candidatus Limnocylindrales bacterium]
MPLAVAAVSVIQYLPAVRYGFVFDDLSLLDADGTPQPLGGWIPYRPVRYLSYFVDHWLGGTPQIFHLDNALLHAAVAALVTVLARRFGSGRTAAAAAGLFVAVHPLAVEAAAYVAGRRDLLCVLFGLGAVLAQHGGRLRSAMALLVLSVAAKESGLVFAAPLVATSILAIDAEIRARGARSRRVAAVLAAVCAAAACMLAYGATGPWLPPLDLSGVALAGRVAVHYATGVAGLRALRPEYPELTAFLAHARSGDVASLLLGSLATSAALAALASFTMSATPDGDAPGVAGCSRSGARDARRIVFAWFATTVVALSIWGGLHEPGADRHAYLLLPPLAIGLALALSKLSKPAGVRFAVTACVVVVLCVLASASRAQMTIWSSDRALWASAVSGPSPSSRARTNYARVLAGVGQYDAAVSHLDIASRESPGDPLPYLARAAIDCATRHPARTRRDLAGALERGAEPGAAAEIAASCAAVRQDVP